MEKAKLVGYLDVFHQEQKGLKFERPIFSFEDRMFWLDLREDDKNAVDYSILIELDSDYIPKVKPVKNDEIYEFEDYKKTAKFYMLRVDDKFLYGFLDEIVDQLLDNFTFNEITEYDSDLSFLYFLIFNRDYLSLEKYLKVFNESELRSLTNKIDIDNWMPREFKSFFKSTCEMCSSIGNIKPEYYSVDETISILNLEIVEECC